MRPKHRPPRPKHPKFTHFHRSGLRFGRFPAQRRSIGGVGRHRWAWPRCRWVAAGPGRASRRRVELPNSDPAPQVWRTPEGPEGTATVPVGGGRARAGLEIDHSEPQARVWRSRGRAAAHRHTQRPGPTKQPGPAAGSDGARNTRGGHKQPGPAGSQERLRLGDLAARLAQGQAAVAVDGGTHVDEARARQERRVGAGAKLADGVQAFGGEAPSELGHEVGH